MLLSFTCSCTNKFWISGHLKYRNTNWGLLIWYTSHSREWVVGHPIFCLYQPVQSLVTFHSVLELRSVCSICHVQCWPQCCIGRTMGQCLVLATISAQLDKENLRGGEYLSREPFYLRCRWFCCSCSRICTHRCWPNHTQLRSFLFFTHCGSCGCPPIWQTHTWRRKDILRSSNCPNNTD